MSNLTWGRFKLKMQQMFGMDLRSIALFRVVMALCVIGDMLERLTDLRVMYTEEGIMPRSLIVTRYSSNFFFPIHLINTSWGAQLFFFWIHIGFAFLMMIGYRTKTFSVLTWFMTISLQAYNGVIGHGGDVFFRMMLFINMFLPTAQFYSVDTATFATEKQKPIPTINSTHNDIETPSSGIIVGQHSPQQHSANGGQDITISKDQNSQEISLDFSSVQKQDSYYKYKPLTAEYSNRYRFLSFATFAVLLQMGCMYVASFFHKTGEEWKNGEATFYAITLDYFATDFAKFLVQFREPLRLMTLAVAKWELFGIFFMSIPFWTDYFRLFAAFGFFCMHAGFVSCLRLGLFFFVTAGAQAINIPPFAWDRFFNWADQKILKGQRPLRVHYNTTSPLSQYITLTLKTFFILPNTAEFSPLERINPEDRISSVSSPINISTIDDEETSEDEETIEDNGILLNRKPTSNSSTKKQSNRISDSKSLLLGDDWLVTIDGNGIRKSNIHALLLICSKSPLLFPFAWACNYIPSSFSEAFFGRIMLFIHQKTQQSQIQEQKPSLYQEKKQFAKPLPRYYGWVNNIWMAFICWFLLAYNLHTFRYFNLGYKSEYNQFGYLLRLDQGWNMFSPSPPKTHWWHVIHGNLEDGTPVELFKKEGIFNFEINKEVSFDKPDPFYPSYGNHRWFKYWENGFNQYGADPMRLEMGRYICREFNKRHFGHEQLYRFTIYFVHEFQHLNGTLSSPPQHAPLWDHVCY
ncbi:hypothetical protein DLAC_00351 [Tieghemostelium lacteum]|uniref:HTTM-like domain-containing protein n=1 Tax=Tieghemostelium lacteum TaxID=361077 RepID=A0A152A9H7_TIELA|nr:hypothetical protein DLAC_00351 [Tieghemostelium lacteum]|eukprot:KYR02878.1 hypothetical protein DLAC_00351 [Tieghemostelium lacteum]